MSAKPVTYKKRAVSEQCRAKRCKVGEPLYEFETTDPKVGVALLCEGHWRRATDNAQAPAPVGPQATEGDPPGEAPPLETAPPPPATEPVAPVELAAPAQTAVVVEHAPVLAFVDPIRDEYTGMATQLVGLVIGNQAQVDMAGELLKQIKGKLKTLKTQRMDITRPMDAAKAAVMDLFRPATEAAEALEVILKNGLSTFVEQQLAAKQAALQAGEHQAGLAVLQPEMPKGISTRTTWRFRIADSALIPREFWVIDSAKVQAQVNAQKGQTSIPGIEVYCDTGINASASQ